jgi:hypothetical protein
MGDSGAQQSLCSAANWRDVTGKVDFIFKN